MPVINRHALITNRVAAIRAHHEQVGIPRAEIDVSGGVDSAVMLLLLVRALGAGNVTAVYSSIDSSDESRRHARAVAEVAGVRLCEVEGRHGYGAVVQAALQSLADAGYDMSEIEARCKAQPTIMGSLRSTLRAPLGRFMGRLTGGAIRHGTGNECEDRWLRFYQKGGDGEVDTNPLAMLSKGEVYQLALALGVPHEIIKALPTPDLWGVGDEHNDEAELTALSGVEWSYSRIDLETGEYTKVGTIERLSRFLDHGFSAWFDSLCGINGGWLFAKDKGHDSISGDWEFNMDALVKEAKSFFDPDHSERDVRAFLESARRWERSTRHKFNPNIPALGTRKELLDAGILTDELPEV